MSSELPMEPMAPKAPKGYSDFLMEVKTQIRQRQFQALRAVNSELLALYWWLGENISQRQNALGWGKSVVENLARDLQAEFPGRNGFSAQNLWGMRQFYNEYSDKPKLQSLIGEISWAKNLLIMARCKDDLEREFYLRATARFGWTSKVSQHQLDNHSYRQYLLGQTNFDAAVPESGRVRPAHLQPCAGHCDLHRHTATARKLSGRLVQP
jgi:predicted nuclease of restriction endonuclease-like (RecB) superfamily